MLKTGTCVCKGQSIALHVILAAGTTSRCLAVHHLSLAVHEPPNPLPASQQSVLHTWVHFVTNGWLGLERLPRI